MLANVFWLHLCYSGNGGYVKFLYGFNDAYGDAAYHENELTGGKCEYTVSRFAHIGIFEHYGIRGLCKVIRDGAPIDALNHPLPRHGRIRRLAYARIKVERGH